MRKVAVFLSDASIWISKMISVSNSDLHKAYFQQPPITDRRPCHLIQFPKTRIIPSE